MHRRYSVFRKFRIEVLTLCVFFGLSACSTVPENLRHAPEVMPSIADIQASPETHQNETVRWGGSIVGVDYSDGQTEVEIVSRPLAADTRPVGVDQSYGRFLAVFDGFLEPEIYAEKRLLTVLGTVDGLKTKKIGDLDYDFPLVKVEEHYLWQQEVQPVYPYSRLDPYPWGYWNSPYPYYYYDGFYSPFWHRPHGPYRW